MFYIKIMILVERHYTKGNAEFIRLCQLSKELYNRANFLMRQAWFAKHRLPDVSVLVRETKNFDCFKTLHNTKTAKQTIRKVLNDWSNFRKSLVAYSKNRSDFFSCPKPPNYKNKMAQVIFYNETIKGGKSKKLLKVLSPTNNCFAIRYRENYKQVVITPKTFGFVIEVQYESKEKKKAKVNKNKVCTIDIGLNNLAAITYGQNRPILVNGRIIKSINQWYNKRPCKNRLRKRYWQIENYFHHVSKFVIGLCVSEKIGQIIIGRNKGWKQGINLGKKTNQAFHFVSTYSLLEKIKYKAALSGIDVTLAEEAYTSQASFYDKDPLPEFSKNAKHSFSGKRKKRGLYLTKDGFAVNADVNGSLNIGRKVIPEFSGIRDRSLAARPVVINPLKV